eukprot:Phypoly_transcript_06717.p1 GENE.Phypoly_transcript_06717~~Phypoly_transcript_06717.p1  ORF type:complete len:551 (+),score=146.95 Phypoly_transcript_06717:87-1739(+)
MGKRRFPKKEGVVFKLFYGGGAPGTQAPDTTQQLATKIKNPKPTVVEDDEVDPEEHPQQKLPKAPRGKEPEVDDIEDEEDGDELEGDESFEEGDDEDEGEGEEGEGDEDEFDEEGEGDEGDVYSDEGESSGKRAQSGKRKTEDIELGEDLAFGSDDDYDYSQHIRESGRGVFVPADLDYTEKVLNSLNLGHKVKKLREMAGKQFMDIDEIEDKEVDEALFSSTTDYYTGTLDDDFVIQANGGAPVDVKETEIKKMRRSMGKMKIGHGGSARQLGADEFDADFDEFDDDDDDYDVDATKYIGQDLSGDVERKPRLIDEQFDHLLDQYEDANYGDYMDPRDPDVIGQQEADVDDPIFQEYIIARRKLKGPAHTPSTFNYDAEVDKENLKPIEQPEIVPEDEDEDEGENPLEGLYPEKKQEKWDCDTIISTYSNLENHPKLIVEPSNKIKLSKKTGMPLGVLGTRGPQKGTHQDDQDSEESQDDSSVASNTGKARSKDETPEQRKERKRLVKEEKKANREKKKLVKQAYKSEEIKQTNLMVAQRVNQRVVYKF